MSKRAVLLLGLTLAVLLCLIMPVYASGASRTIVVPDDYPTIAVAISNANDGDTVFVKAGVYEEKTLEIAKTLSLIGEGAESTKINLSPELKVSFPPDLPPDLRKLETSHYFDPSIIVNTDGFRLEGFTINTPNIIDFKKSNNFNGHNLGGEVFITGNRTQIVGNNITTPLRLNGSYCNIEGNTLLEEVTVTGSHSSVLTNRFSGTIWAYGSYLNISANSKSSSNKMLTGDMGIHLVGSTSLIYGNNLTVKDSSPAISLEGDGNFVIKNFVDQANIGLRILGSNNTVSANRITNGWEEYFFPSSSPIAGIGIVAFGNNTFYANYVANNSWGININQYQANSRSWVYQNNFIGNIRQVAADNPYDTYGNDSFDNGETGNFWSDYTGKDANVDGVGDTPYVIDAKRQDNYPLLVPFDIESVTIPLPDWASSGSTTAEPISEAFFEAAFVIIITVMLGAGLLVYFKKRKYPVA